MFNLKRTAALFAALCLLLCGCSPAPAKETALTADEILAIMLSAAPEKADSYTVYDCGNSGDGLALLCQFYGLSPEAIADAAFAQGCGASAFELSVVRLSEVGDSDDTVARFCQRLESRAGDFTGYAPDQADLARNGLVLSSGDWVVLLICADPASVGNAFSDCFEAASAFSAPAYATPDGAVPFTSPGIDDMTPYDTSSILDAWKRGDDTALTEKDAAILAAAQAVLAQTIHEGMSDYEKEKALYTWLCTEVDYDWNHQNGPQYAAPDSGNPYGALVDHTAICLGFATAFQLLMDMADVECITVIGAAFSSQEDHAWNMVRLNGEWYCVDATWDLDALTYTNAFCYFNVTSDFMAITDHQWDYANVPLATAYDGGLPQS